jgi:hypothetical protein
MQGWLSWQRYRCNMDCTNDPDNCFSEKLIKKTIDSMVSEGYKAAGYEYVNLDDCWQAEERVNGHLVAHPTNFPSGIKALAKYAHDAGMKLGLYTAMGNGTCANDGGKGVALGLGCDFGDIPTCTRAKMDIDDFVSWDIDHLKVDGCGQFDRVDQNNSYAIVGHHLLEAVKKRGTGPVVYHPSNLGFRYPRQFGELVSIANQWRWFDDVDSTWKSISSIIEEVGAGQPHCVDEPLPLNCTTDMMFGDRATYCSRFCSEVQRFVDSARPGAWPDPDMLVVGNTREHSYCACGQ